MNINRKFIIGLLITIGVWFGLAAPVHADTQNVPLAVLKAGTHDTSYAASYFANSASVTSLGNGSYTVTSTVTTSKKLGNYPVQILSVNGAPASVTRSDQGNAQTITYSFQTSNPAALNNAVIKVDVNSINYHHTYNVGLQLDVSNLKQDTANQNNEAKQGVDDSVTDQPDAGKDAAKNDSEKASKKDSSSNESKSEKKNDASNKDDNSDYLKNIAIILGSGLGIGILAAIVTLWFMSRKK